MSRGRSVGSSLVSLRMACVVMVVGFGDGGVDVVGVVEVWVVS